jgi:hypothetical protein
LQQQCLDALCGLLTAMQGCSGFAVLIMPIMLCCHCKKIVATVESNMQPDGFVHDCAGIMAVEAYHAGYIRTALIQNGDVVTPYGVNVTTIVNAIATARETLDGSVAAGMPDDEGIYNATTGDYILAPVDSNAVAFSRNTTQVLDIVYLGSSTEPGGFYPNGMNGNIR